MSRLDSTASTPTGHQRVGPFPKPEGVIVYWHVDNVPATYDQLLSMGAKPHEAPRDFGEGFIGASVIDPFGNILGIIVQPALPGGRGCGPGLAVCPADGRPLLRLADGASPGRDPE